MTKTDTTSYGNGDGSRGITSLPTAMRHPVAMLKYAEAVRTYSETDLRLSDIARQFGLTPSGLSVYISRHHRDILLKKYGIVTLDCAQRIKQGAGQSIYAYKKYKSAIEACSNMAYIEYNVSQIAVMFDLNASALAAQLRFHYPDVIPEREKKRLELGFSDNPRRGARPECVEAYSDAVAMYRDTDMTVRDVAEACNVSVGGLNQHLQFYCKSVVGQKADRRNSRVNTLDENRTGTLSGNGRMYGPNPETVEKYSKALELYRTSDMTLKEIIKATGVTYAGFRSYIRLWHSGERQPRSNVRACAGKYAPAIESLRENPRNMADVAAEFGFNPDAFRDYLQRHAPDLAAAQGMTRRCDGRLVRRLSAEKYARAIEEYAGSTDTLKDIAERHGLVYNSLSAYVRRNCHAETESHRKKLLAAT